jgi:hypothetical protein
MVMKLSISPNKVMGLDEGKIGTLPTSPQVFGIVQWSEDCQSEVEVMEKHSAGMLQMENTSPNNTEDSIMTDKPVTTLPDAKEYFPDTILDWDTHHFLVNNPDKKSDELTVAGKHGELTTHLYIYAQKYKFKWHRTVSETVSRALLGIDKDATLKYNRGSIGSKHKALRMMITKRGGMYLMENEYAFTTKTQ